jgi:hypothetical protein
MKLSTVAKSALTLIVLMIGLLILGAAFGVNLGPVEVTIWFVILVVGLALIVAGARRTPKDTGQ